MYRIQMNTNSDDYTREMNRCGKKLIALDISRYWSNETSGCKW